MENATAAEIQSEIEKMIYKSLDKTERWARENYNGDPEYLEDFVFEARNEKLMAIGEAVRRYQNIDINPLGNQNN